MGPTDFGTRGLTGIEGSWGYLRVIHMFVITSCLSGWASKSAARNKLKARGNNRQNSCIVSCLRDNLNDNIRTTE